MGKGGRSSSSSGSRSIDNRDLCCQPESDVSNHGLITIATLGSQTCSACPSVGNSSAVHDIYPCRCVLRYSCNTNPRRLFHAQYPIRAMIPLPTKMHVKMYVTLPTLAEVIFGLNRISWASSWVRQCSHGSALR
jgi:hypothetical protein